MKTMKLVCLLVSGLLTLPACEKKEPGSAGHEHKGVTPATIQASSYADAMRQIEEHSTAIAALINQGKLGDVPHEAAAIQTLANRLPDLASSKPANMLDEIRTTSQRLANSFTAIDEAADGGDKSKTVAAHDRMKALIAKLKRHDH